MKRSMQKGFTLIELMIVVAIIGILAAVALPAYQDYVVKSKVAAAVTGIDSLKTAVALCSQETGSLTACNTTASGAVTSIPVFTATSQLQAATVAAGVITAQFSASGIKTGVDGLKFTVTPSSATDQTTIKWTVAAASANPVTDAKTLAELTKNN